MTMLLDTRTVPPADRPDYWSAGIEEHFFPLSFSPQQDRPFAGWMTGGDIGPISVRKISGDPHTVMRTPRTVSATDPESILLYLLLDAACGIEQDGRACALRPGDLASQITSHPSLLEAQSPFSLLVLSFPRWFVGTHADRIAARTAVRVDTRSTSLARLVAPFLAGTARTVHEGGFSGAEQAGVAEMLASMLRALYGDVPDEQAPGRRSGALLARMREWTMAHLHEPDLGPERIARAHFVSTRYVHKLFASDGSGVSAWIRERRLEAALRDLRDPGLLDRPIAAIAAARGFPDAASFSRAFRRAYGRSPREARGSG